MSPEQALGTPYQVFYEGRMWKLSPFNEGIKADYVAWLKASAEHDAFKLEGVLTPSQWKKSYTETKRQINARELDWLGDVCMGSITQPPSMMQLVTIMLRGAGETPPQGDELFAMVTSPIMSKALSTAIEDASPKPKAPAATEQPAQKTTATEQQTTAA